MASASSFVGTVAQFGAHAEMSDIFRVLLDDVTSMLCIIAVMGLVKIIAKRRFGWPSSPIPQTKTKARSGHSDSSMEQKRAGDVAHAAHLRLFAAAVRSGRASELPRLLDEAEARRGARACLIQDSADETLNELMACLSMCVTAGCFKEGLAAYDHLAARLPPSCGSLWSALLYCAIEVGEFQRCLALMEKVWEQGEASSKDLINMSRCFAQQNDVQGMIQLLRRFRETGERVDIITRNRILAACIARGRVDMTEAVVAETVDTPMDIIGYHSLIKGYSQSGNLQRCLELYEQLRVTSEPNKITFGLLLDACVDAGFVDGARKIFTDLQHCHGIINVVHYTSFIRCLTSSGEFEEAYQTFDNMLATPGVTPDFGSWYGLIKALADKGLVDKSVRIVERMRELQFEATQTTFNVVLNGCSSGELQPGEIFDVFERLLKLGMQPTTPILSVMVKALSSAKAWSQAEELLGSVHSRFGIPPDERLFAQLRRAKRTSSAGVKGHI